MKKILLFVVLFISGLLFTACSSSDDNPSSGPTPPSPTPTAESDIVLMYYCVGGGDLDDDTEGALADVAYFQESKFPNARTFVQFKYSSKPNPRWASGYQMSGDPGCVYRFEASKAVLNPRYAVNETDNTNNITKIGKVFSLDNTMKKGDKNFKMYDPNNLKDFINWCMEQAPNAKAYVLAFGDHGGAYSITSDYNKSLAQSRGVMYDENFDGSPCMTPSEIATAVKAVGKKIDLLFFDCCLMSNLEVLSELKSTNLIDYVLASGHSVIQSPLDQLLEDMVSGLSKGSWVDGAKQYVGHITKLMEDGYKSKPHPKGRNMDYTLTDMSKLPAALASIKAVAEYLSNLPKDVLEAKKDEFTEAASSCYQYDNSDPLYDICSYFNMLKEKVFLGDAAFTQLVENAKSAIYACHAAHQEYNYINETEKDKPHWNLSYSVTIGFTSSRLDFSLVKEADKRNVQKQGVIMVAIQAGKGTEDDPYYNDYAFENGDNYYSSWTNSQEENVRFVNNYYAKGSHPYKNWDNTYRTTAFDLATGWSKWIKVNTGIPYDNPPHNDEGNNVFDQSLDDFLNDLNDWLDEINKL